MRQVRGDALPKRRKGKKATRGCERSECVCVCARVCVCMCACARVVYALFKHVFKRDGSAHFQVVKVCKGRQRPFSNACARFSSDFSKNFQASFQASFQRIFKGRQSPLCCGCVVVWFWKFGFVRICFEFCVWLFGDLSFVCVRVQATALPGHVSPWREVRGLGGARNGR